MFDALSYSESLAKLGVPEDNAKLQAKALTKAFESNDLATKEDIIRSESKMTEAIVRLELKLTSNMSDMRFEFIRWMIGMFFAITGMMFTLLKLMLP